MKVFVYGFRQEEEPYFTACAKRYGIELGTSPQRPTLKNAHLAVGYPCVSMLSTPCDSALIQEFNRIGVRFLSTRTIGYDHIDLNAAKQIGMAVSNATYAPESVADYTIMLILMTLRKMKLIMKRAEGQDYSFAMVEGQNLKGKTLGVIGCGNIGKTLIQHIHGFGCQILVHSHREVEECKPYARFVDLETIWRESDIITLHLPLHEETHHIVNAQAFSMMKDGVMIINTA